MTYDAAQASNDADPASLMDALIAETPPILGAIQDLVGPIHDERDRIRALLGEMEAIRPMPTCEPTTSVAAVDGAYTITPLAVGDHISTLATAAVVDDGGVGVTGHRAWSDFRAHTDEQDTLATGVMMAQEAALLTTLPQDCVGIVDGSHVTALIAVTMALASTDDTVRDQMIAVCEDASVVEGFDQLAAASGVVACPKADSSRNLWEMCATRLRLGGTGLPDKVLASLVLDPGEVLVSDRAAPAWERFYATTARVDDHKAKVLASRLADAIEPLRGQQVSIIHAKPEGATVAVRVEIKPTVDEFMMMDQIAAICGNCEPPYIQEPLSQHLADTFAKQVSTNATVQLANARLDLSEQGESTYLDHLLRHYRTS